MIRSVRPLSEGLDDSYKLLGEPEINDGKPIDIRAWLQANEVEKELIEVTIQRRSFMANRTNLYLYRLLVGIEVFAVIRMNVPSLPVQFVVHDLVHIRIGESNVVGIEIDQMAEFEPVTDVHEQTTQPVSVGERHLRVQVAILVGRPGRLVHYDRRIDQVAVTDKWHVPQSPETDFNE